MFNYIKEYPEKFSLIMTGPLNSIGPELFKGCELLVHIEIPKSVTHIKQSAFWLCNSLESIEFSKNLKIIHSKAFWGV